MKKIVRWLNELFNPTDLNGLDMDAIRSAFNDSSVRNLWLTGLFDELRRINLEVDKRLLSNPPFRITDLCARRRAYQDVLDSVLIARRQVTGTQSPSHNPPFGGINLDRVTR